MNDEDKTKMAEYHRQLAAFHLDLFFHHKGRPPASPFELSDFLKTRSLETEIGAGSALFQGWLIAQ